MGFGVQYEGYNLTYGLFLRAYRSYPSYQENVLGYFQGYYGSRGLQFYFRTLAKLLATVSICAKLVTTTHLFTILSREITLTSYTVSIYGPSLPPPSVV